RSLEGVQIDIRGMLHDELKKITQEYNRNKAIARTLPPKAVLAVNLLTYEKCFIKANLETVEPDYQKIIGRKLIDGEFALVLYADGTTEVKLSDCATDSLANLSSEQQNFIVQL